MQRQGWACMPLPPRLCVGCDFPVGWRASFQLCRVTRDHERSRQNSPFKTHLQAGHLHNTRMHRESSIESGPSSTFLGRKKGNLKGYGEVWYRASFFDGELSLFQPQISPGYPDS